MAGGKVDTVEKNFNDSLVAVSRGQMERGQAGLGQKIGIGSVIDQHPDHLSVPVSGGKVERSHSSL